MTDGVIDEAPAGPFVALLFFGPLPALLVIASMWMPMLFSDALSPDHPVEAPVLIYSIALLLAVASPLAMILIAHRARVRFGPDVLVTTVLASGVLCAAIAILATSIPLFEAIAY